MVINHAQGMVVPTHFLQHNTPPGEGTPHQHRRGNHCAFEHGLLMGLGGLGTCPPLVKNSKPGPCTLSMVYNHAQAMDVPPHLLRHRIPPWEATPNHAGPANTSAIEHGLLVW